MSGASGEGRVRQLRLVVEAEDYDAAVRFCRDVMGMPGGVALGSPIAAVKRAWGLSCLPFGIPPGNASNFCQGLTSVGGSRYIVQVGDDQLGRVSDITAHDPRWKTRRGVGPGDPLSRLRSAYGARLRSRVTKAWSYFETDGRLGARPTRTVLVGRTRYQDVWSVASSSPTR